MELHYCFLVLHIVMVALLLAVLGSSFICSTVSGMSTIGRGNFPRSLQLSQSWSGQLLEDFLPAADHEVRHYSPRGRSLGPSTGSASSRREVEVLMAFKMSVVSDPLHALKGWNGNDSDPCHWMGVRCSPSTNNIVELKLSSLQLVGVLPGMLDELSFLELLDLSDNNLKGSIPDSIANCSKLLYMNISYNQVSGEIPSQIGELSDLLTLDVTKNRLIGQIPEAIGNCSFLTHLNLQNNFLEGGIPLRISELSSLTFLSISNNSLSGSIPRGLGNCSSLAMFSISNNSNLGGELPEELSGLKKMQVFLLYNCNFVGAFPTWITNFTSLVTFYCNGNSFSGEIPEEIGLLSENLSYLGVYRNQLTGTIPQALVNCTSLIYLDVNYNQLTGNILPGIGLLCNLEFLNLSDNELSGDIPSSISNCSALIWLQAGHNPLRSQTIPLWIASLTSLERIWLPGISLHGEIPPELGQLSNLQYLTLDRNYLGGDLPITLGNLTHLQKLGLSRNQLEGKIPSEITGNLSSLVFIDLSENFFVGSIPDLSTLIDLQVFAVISNLLTGNLDSNIGVGNPQLYIFYVDDNNFTGPMPGGIGNFSDLQALSLPFNSFAGSIPPQWGNLSSLGYLDVKYNKLEGVIPVELTRCAGLFLLSLQSNKFKGSIPWEVGQLVSLQKLFLSFNFFSGTIPSSFANLTNMGVLVLGHNGFSGNIPGGLLSNMAAALFSLDLSHNTFSGTWPIETNLLINLQLLDISANDISGFMSPGLVSCTGLESLDVSTNNLTGMLPVDLGLLRHLQYFNASFNDFDGPIPSMGFFQTRNITKDSFMGNPRLCGSTSLVSHQCPLPSQTTQHSCKGFKCGRIWIPVASTSATLFMVFFGGVIWYWVFASNVKRKVEVEDTKVVMNFPFQQRIVLTEVELMRIISGEQDNVIGTGAKSIVYKGLSNRDEKFAIKVLREDSSSHRGEGEKSKTDELLREVHTLAKLRHKNIIKVLGVCITPKVKALMLEYMSSGSLYDHLYNRQGCHLSRGERFKIILGVAESLVYLHHYFHEPIIHRDLKPSNILLNTDLEPKLGDFGISKFAQHPCTGGELEASASVLCGTFGYMPPEYATQSSISTKGDVYSYGVLVLEVLTGKKPISASEDGFKLVEYVMESFEERPFHLLDPTLLEETRGNSVATDQVMLLFRVGFLCTRPIAKMRPSMKDVLEMLQQIRDIDVPNAPLRSIDELANGIATWTPS